MIEGLLWLDADPKRPLATKVQRAAARYQQKYTRRPDVCYVNPAVIDGVTEVDGIRLVAASNRQAHEFWIGEDAGVILHCQNGNGAEPPVPAVIPTQVGNTETAAEPVPRDGGTVPRDPGRVAEAGAVRVQPATSHGQSIKFICKRCEAEAIDPQATKCWSCGYDGRE